MANLRAHAALLLPQFPPTLARFLNSHEILLDRLAACGPL
jgi:hypothetical protein